MLINPLCDKCNQDLTAFGGILFSPPDAHNRVDKSHLCKGCYQEVIKEFKHTKK
jgi:hypothetical protein